MVVLLYRVLYFMIWLALGASGGVVGVYDQPAAAVPSDVGLSSSLFDLDLGIRS